MSDEVKMPDPKVEAFRFRLPGPSGDPEFFWEPIIRDVMARTLRAAAAKFGSVDLPASQLGSRELERMASEIEKGKP